MQFDRQNKKSIQELFNKVAHNYDKLNNYMSLGFQKIIKDIAVKNSAKKLKNANAKILDLCCGTGDISVLLKKHLPNSKIIGVDFSENMLEIAKNRAQNISFYRKDITDLGFDFPFEEKTFDLCFISFGLRNLPDIDNFLENIKCYLKNDGILSILDLGKPALFMKPYFILHYEFFIPILAKFFNKDIMPYKYFVNSSKTYPSQKEMLEKLKQHGFINVENHNFAFGIISQQIGSKNSLCG